MIYPGDLHFLGLLFLLSWRSRFEAPKSTLFTVHFKWNPKAHTVHLSEPHRPTLRVAVNSVSLARPTLST